MTVRRALYNFVEFLLDLRGPAKILKKYCIKILKKRWRFFWGTRSMRSLLQQQQGL